MRLKKAIASGALIGALSLSPAFQATAHPIGPADAVPASPAPQPAEAASQAPATVETEASIYTVLAGDSLSAIGPRTGRTWEQLAGWNHLTDPNLILVGQVLQLPPASYSPPPAQSTVIPATAHMPPQAASPAPPANPPARSPAPVVVASANVGGVWQCIGHYESGNNPAENTGNGYYGEWQFAPQTWDTMMSQLGLGYRSYPYAAGAPEGVQLQAAEHLQAEAGWGQWPVTSRECGV